MRKTKLSLEALQVDTFEPDPAAAEVRGTVHAHGPSQYTAYCQCANATNYGSCQATCMDTCGGPTCDYPCQTADTCYLTCRDACGWTYGDVVCKQTP